VSSQIVTNGNKTTSYTNAASKKTRAELDAIKNKKNMTHSQIMKDMEDEFAAKKKEKEDFSKLTATDRSKMSLEQLLELQRRMRDLGIKGQNMKKGGVVNKTGKTYRKGGFVKRPSKKKEEYYEKYSDQGIENELDTPSEMLKELRNKESKDIKNKVIFKMPIYEIVPPPRKKQISASINLKKGGAVRKKSIMLKGRGGSFKGVK
jgi:ribosomal protein S17E